MDNKFRLANGGATRYNVADMSPFTFVVAAVGMVWLTLLLASAHTRFEQLVMSLFGLFVAPAALLMVSPGERFDLAAASGSSDLVFVVLVFGIAAALYHILLEERVLGLNGTRVESGRHMAHWISHLMIGAGAWMTVAIASRLVFAVPAPQAFALGGLLVGLYVMADRKELLLKALLTGAIVSALVFVTESLFAVHLFAAASHSLAGLPAEEMLWAAVVGFTVGPLYEFARHVRST